MVTSHLQLDARWATCGDLANCVLPFHVPGLTPEEALLIPQSVLTEMLEALDPPSQITSSGMKLWFDTEGWLHRDYDLPAAIWPDGTAYWNNHGDLHRDNGLPAEIHVNGVTAWYEHGVRVRTEDREARESGFDYRQVR